MLNNKKSLSKKKCLQKEYCPILAYNEIIAQKRDPVKSNESQAVGSRPYEIL